MKASRRSFVSGVSSAVALGWSALSGKLRSVAAESLAGTSYMAPEMENDQLFARIGAFLST